jgi:hypothetical protein
MSTNQNDNVVGGSIAGRDLTITNNYPVSTQIKLLCERLQSEGGDAANPASDFIEELQHYLDRPASEFGRTLVEKLVDSNRAELVEVAQEMKERAMKKIMRFQSSRTAQEIFAYVLGELHTRFLLHVRPLIASQASRAEVDAAMQEKVIAPVADALGPSPLALNPSLVLALLFYLAGNCHIKWD